MRLDELKEKLKNCYRPDARRFHELMSRRIKTILMVSTRYEAFSLAWDGSLAEDIYGTYSLLHLQNVPQITTVTSPTEALEALRREHFDLVLVSSNLAGIDINGFGLEIKTLRPGLPVVMLIFAGAGLSAAMDPDAYPGIDHVFSWQGSAKVLFSLIKLVEDSLNIEKDTSIVRIGVILVVEDSIKQYSFFLPHLYTILMRQAFSRVPFGVDENERQLLTRTRPKILLARTFAEAEALVARTQPFLHGMISDLRVTAEEGRGSETGPHFLRRTLEAIPGLPILLVSADENAPRYARSLGIPFVDKQSPQFIKGVEDFCLTELGFGDFVFRSADGRELRRARTLREFENALPDMPDECIEFLSRRNLFSHWLLAQGETALAELLRPVQSADFGSIAELRDFIRSATAIARREKHRGIIADFQSDDFEPDYTFLITGRGSLGGKARGLAFMFNLLSRPDIDGRLGGMEIRVPRTLVITTDAFDQYMTAHSLYTFGIECDDDRLLKRKLRECPLPARLMDILRSYIRQVRVPLAVRSSSHMEDSSTQPFAGLYETVMLRNAGDGEEERLLALADAVKRVYASAYSQTIKNYFRALNLNMAEEKMAVIVQELVGWRQGNLYYPVISGVAQSFNYYPFSRMEPGDGVASIAIGFGKTVVEGGNALRFCPKFPNLLPQASAPGDLLRISQQQFYALSLDEPDRPFEDDNGNALRLFPLERAEQDGTLYVAGSVVTTGEGQLVDDLGEKGPRVVTFAPVLKRGLFPLCAALNDVLKVGRESLGSEVEIEFAANADAEGRRPPEFHLLQIRPMATSREHVTFPWDERFLQRAVCASRQVMGNGKITGIHDVVYCRPERFSAAHSRAIADAVGPLNRKLTDAHRPYLLIGPGRWGTRVPSLGIPVNWAQVAGAVVIVETELQGRSVDPSQGAHFFHNLAATGIGYFTLRASDPENFIRWEALDALPAEYEDACLRHVRCPDALTIYMDALNHRGAVITQADRL
ncbi:MAG: hypothetical protein HY343_08835 [Lentisphaerae bacterium]|nr:hypothetical protein [Lentisphaerota bacterium]